MGKPGYFSMHLKPPDVRNLGTILEALGYEPGSYGSKAAAVRFALTVTALLLTEDRPGALLAVAHGLLDRIEARGAAGEEGDL